MVRTLIAFAVVGFLGLLFVTPASAQCGMGGGCCGGGKVAKSAASKEADAGEPVKIKDSFLSSYFTMWKALGGDDLKGVPEAKKVLASALEAATKAPAQGLSEKDRGQRAKLLASAQAAVSKLEISDLKTTRAGFGVLSGELRKFVEAFPAEADAYVVYCGMAKKSWLQDSPKVLNPYYGSTMSECGQVVRRPNPGKGFTCPMHPAVVRDKAGDCPICSMKLVPVPKEGPGKTGEKAEEPKAESHHH